MKRINEKVKDIVQVRKFLSLQDFSEDSAATLEAYRFTEATAELMTKWLDRVVELQSGQGNALALAGYRGVGKSHFLAVLAAIAAQPDLRTKISDDHVAAAAQQLLRRRYPCVLVRRGTRSTLIDELKAAVGATFGIDQKELPERTFDIINVIRSRSGDVPFLLFIDTAIERSTRVTRDDGTLLAEMAEAVKPIGGLIGVALDDDIAGADGSNASIVRSFAIDYLDQEHLYKVVDSYVFPKNQHLRPVLHDVYAYFRSVMPTFRWSEQRFGSLYPLHPAILDVAPFVRLYVNDFALLSFAADAGEKILGRPANSLIALDEVFDASEKELRKSEELKGAFETYDRLNADVVGKVPVMQRLQAKLILKALLVLSLEGQGTTAGEISSGTLIFDENDPKKANNTVEEIVRMFAAAMPDDVKIYAEEGREVRYGLKVGGNDGLKQALELAAATVGTDQVAETLYRLFHERFTDSLLVSPDGAHKFAGECSIVWRGGTRRGRVLWKDSRVGPGQPSVAIDEHHEWEVVVDLSSEGENVSNELPRAVWKPAELSPDEIDAVKRFYTLQHDPAIREKFADNIRAAFHSHMLILDRVLNRVFMEDGHLVIDGFDYNLSEDARSSPTLSALFSSMLEPLFEMRYPQHPFFLQNLGIGEVSSLISDLYSGSRQKLGDVQQIAQTFGLPLGLVKLSEGVYYPANREQLLSLETVKSVEALLDGAEGSLELSKVYLELRKPPYGLIREAQQLILAAMVSQRMVEFVTSKGDRINQRSLDLKMIWDDIVGLARPQESAYSSTKLARWAVSFSGRQDIKDPSLDSDLAKFREGASEWLEAWDSERVLGRFNAVPEELLTTGIWKTVSRVSKSLGAASSLIRKFLEGQTPVEECLGRLSELFMDDKGRLEASKGDLEVVRLYLEGWEERERLREYALTAVPTGDDRIEGAREALVAVIADFELSPDKERERKISYAFSRFKRDFGQYFVEKHDAVMRSHDLQEKADQFLSSDTWWIFENLASISRPTGSEANIEKLRRGVAALDCSISTQKALEFFPRCQCSFDPLFVAEWGSIVVDLEVAVRAATQDLLCDLRQMLSGTKTELEDSALNCSDESLVTAITDVVRFLADGKLPGSFSKDHVRAFRLAHSLITHDRSQEPDQDTPLLTEADIESAVLSLA